MTPTVMDFEKDRKLIEDKYMQDIPEERRHAIFAAMVELAVYN